MSNAELIVLRIDDANVALHWLNGHSKHSCKQHVSSLNRTIPLRSFMRDRVPCSTHLPNALNAIPDVILVLEECGIHCK